MSELEKYIQIFNSDTVELNEIFGQLLSFIMDINPTQIVKLKREDTLAKNLSLILTSTLLDNNFYYQIGGSVHVFNVTEFYNPDRIEGNRFIVNYLLFREEFVKYSRKYFNDI